MIFDRHEFSMQSYAVIQTGFKKVAAALDKSGNPGDFSLFQSLLHCLGFNIIRHHVGCVEFCKSGILVKRTVIPAVEVVIPVEGIFQLGADDEFR